MIRRYWTIVFLLIGVSALFGQNYYWYRNEKIFLEPGDERYVLFSPDTKSGIDASTFIKVGNVSNSPLMWGIQKKTAPITRDIRYISPSFRIAVDSSNIYVTERFYVKLKQKEDYDVLERYVALHNVEIVEKELLKLWYVLACTEKSEGNALYMANMFYESSLFAASEPEFINANRFTCVNDPYFDQQWNLLNTSQNYPRLDINFCDAYAITEGDNSIIIAVIDEGIEPHFDVSHLHSYGFDTESLSYPAQVYGAHGTQCAGIIAAHVLNNHGVAGIAPECSLLSVSFKDDTPYSKLAAGIEYAVDQNAAILSNSWYTLTNSIFIDDAIDYALTDGRNGKGCVVVFAAGNDNFYSLEYPANYSPDIITVGAMDSCAARAIFSNFGHGLDIMAPGVNIPTTSVNMNASGPYRGIFDMAFSGTSAACPHVAAVAGLVLSINPELTRQEVECIILSTAQKVGNYYYDSIAPYGSWNYEMGYGLVDAYTAVLQAHDRYIQDTIYDLIGSYTVSAPNKIFAGRNVTTCVPQGDVVIPSGSEVNYIAGEAIHLKPGFRVQLGARFTASIGSSAASPSAIRERELENNQEDTMVNEKPSDDRTVHSVDPSASKFLKDGQLIIQSGEMLYNAEGRRIK